MSSSKCVLLSFYFGLDFNEIPGEKPGWELHKDADC